MNFHAISGLPRSGSTLLCNLLNQNPQVHATSTSNVPQMLRAVNAVWANNLETQNLLNSDPKETQERMKNALISLISGWYAMIHPPVTAVFDKSRAWAGNNLLLKSLFPSAKNIVLVRDPREVFASCEKQFRKTAIVHNSTEGMLERATELFKPEGIIGAPIAAIENLIRQKPDNVCYIEFDDLCRSPAVTMQRIWITLGMEPFPGHDFENVKNTATDPDGFYLQKFPHKGEGKVTPPADRWQDYVSEDVGERIVQQCNFMGVRFGYW